MNEIKISEKKELGFKARTILNPDGSISVNAEDTAVGYGWTQEKKGKLYIRWETLNGYCKELGFSQEVGKGDYIPESLFYMLGFKAGNDRALKYQQWLAMEVLPSLRKNGSYEMPKEEKKDKPKKESRASVNMTVKTIDTIFSRAGVDPLYIAVEAKRIYAEAGYDIKIPLITDKETMSKLYDCTSLAEAVGAYSEKGNPHTKAISAILQKLTILESEIVTTPYSRNGHDGVTIQYKPSVLEKIREWLEENYYPTKIPYTDSKGKQTMCTVVYRDM